MKVVFYIGSSFHLKGSRDVVQKLQRLISENQLEDKVTLSGTFCMGNCRNGVGVKVDDEYFSVSSDTTEEFFEDYIIGRL